MYERILVPLDGSRFSEEIIPYAAGLATPHGIPLTLLRVIDKASLRDEAQHYVDRLAASHGARSLCLLETGDVARTLAQESEREPATLLAMTSRGHSGLAEAVLGSVAQRVMRGVKGPVLIYHPTGIHNPRRLPVRLSRVVLPLEGGSGSEAIAPRAAEFARWARASLEVVSAVESMDAAAVGEVSGSEMPSLESGYVRSKAGQLGRQYGIQVDWDVLHGDPAEAIADHVAARHDVILAMTTRRRDPLETALLGSVAAGCLNRAGVPILMCLS
jgi:nucleotide-binding universal stress UspA family protein